VAIGYLAARVQSELMIRRLQFIRGSKQAAMAAAKAGKPQGYYYE